MAAIFPDEGLDVVLGSFPKGGSAPATLYVGLFTSSSGGTSVPAHDATIAAMGAGYAEVDGTWSTYARQPVTAAAWGAPGAGSAWGATGRKSTGPQVTFPQAAGSYTPANPICGFFIADALTGGHAITYSNFGDSSTVPGLAPGDTVKVTPSLGFAN